MLLEGVVTNVTNFGAFVDIGVHQDGLVHISALADTFVRDPREVVKAGDVVKVGSSRSTSPAAASRSACAGKSSDAAWKTAWTRSSRERSGRQRFSLS